MSAGKKFQIFHHIDQKTIDSMYNEYSPVFILTTGRSGSKFIHNILSKQSELISYHEAFPTLQYFSNYAFHNQRNMDILEHMFQAARMELLLEAYNNNKIYVESNQCLSFFAKAILKAFRKAKFIHLLRHPGTFVRSAIMKGWHLNDSIWESGRVKMDDLDVWRGLDHIEKLAWVWENTNAYISTFLQNLTSGSYLTVRFEDITTSESELEKLLCFVDNKNTISRSSLVELKKIKVNELLIHSNEPPSMKKMNFFPNYADWPNEHKQKIKKYVGLLSKQYGYLL